MLFFADVSIFARLPFKTRRIHLNDMNIFLSLAVFWLHFGTLKGPNGFLAFLVPRSRNNLICSKHYVSSTQVGNPSRA